jgi:hypothetical protein
MNTIALATIALAGLVVPCPEGPAMRALRLLRQDCLPNEYAVNPFAQPFREPESLLDGVQQGMRRVRPGMNRDEAERLLGVTKLTSSIWYRSAFGFAHVFKVGESHSLMLRYDSDEPGLRCATLFHGDQVIEQVGR